MPYPLLHSVVVATGDCLRDLVCNTSYTCTTPVEAGGACQTLGKPLVNPDLPQQAPTPNSLLHDVCDPHMRLLLPFPYPFKVSSLFLYTLYHFYAVLSPTNDIAFLARRMQKLLAPMPNCLLVPTSPQLFNVGLLLLAADCAGNLVCSHDGVCAVAVATGGDCQATGKPVLLCDAEITKRWARRHPS